MKKLGILAGVLGIAGLGLAGLAWAQQGQPPVRPAAPVAAGQPNAPTPRTRVAVVNMAFVIKNYQKFQATQQDSERQLKVMEDQLENKKKLLMGMKTETENPQTTPQRREQLEHDMRKVQHEMQEMGDDFKMQFGKRQGEVFVQMYREIQDAVQSYARASDLEMVFHYNDAVTPADMYHPMNIQRKLQGGGCMPMYIAPGMDISERIVSMLNSRYQAAAPAAPAPGVQPVGFQQPSR